MIKNGTALLTLALVMLTAACKDGGKGPYGMGKEVSLSGTLSYERVPATAFGLDYAATVTLPMRGVSVYVVLSDGSIYKRATTDAAGAYSIRAPANATVTLRAVAQLGDPEDPDVQVTDGSAVYNIGTSLELLEVDQTVSLTATSGWNGSDYTAANRTAAPFAILDTISTCMGTVRAAAPGISFPALKVDWGPSKSGSFFSPSENTLQIAGIANTDTDEYDIQVVAHEWGHYYMNAFSLDDSIGGAHSYGDILDETVAWSEGVATALGGMLLGGDPIYIDTYGAGQSFAAAVSMETDNTLDSDTVLGIGLGTVTEDGWYGELTITEMCWDLYDATNSDETSPLTLGFAPIHAALTGTTYTGTAYFSSVFQFLAALKSANSSSAAAINAIAAAENIPVSTSGVQADTFSLGARYRVLTVGATITTDNGSRPLQTWSSFGATNKLFNYQFFAVELAVGTYTLTVTPAAGANTFVRDLGGSTFGTGAAGIADVLTLRIDAAGALVFAVGAETANAAFTIKIETAPST